MSEKIVTSSVSFPSGPSTDRLAVIDQTKLLAAITSEYFVAFALTFVDDPDITLTKVEMKAVTSPNEIGVILPEMDAGAAATLAALNENTKPAAGGVPSMKFLVRHGAQLVLSGNNGNAGPKTLTILWKVLNFVVGPQTIPGRAGTIITARPETQNLRLVGPERLGGIGIAPFIGDVTS